MGTRQAKGAAGSRRDGARARLIEEHLPLVESVARRYRASGEPHEDLVQVGTIGLIKAIDRFDADRGHKLSTVAVPAIEGEIRHHLRDDVALVRTPRPVRELATKVRAKERQLAAGLGREPTMTELAEAVGASDDAVAEAIAADIAPSSLDQEAQASVAPGDPEEASEARLMLAPGWATLDERERRVVQLRYHEDLSQSEIARRMGISQATVSRLLRDVLERLRASLAGEAPEEVAVGDPLSDQATASVAEGAAAPYSRSVATPETEPAEQRPTHSGKLMVRMPATLHAELARVAEREGVSLNTLVTGTLAGAVGWRDPKNPDDLGWPGELDEGRQARRPGWLRTALIANLVVVALAAVAAIALLIAAWSSGW
jgi:RNA polymerase sigma-B factor